MRYALFFLSFFIFPNLSAQKDFSILYLQNGGIYIGKILNDEGYDINMKLADGNEIVFPKSNVKRHFESHRLVVYPDGKYNVTKGFFFHYGSGSSLDSYVRDEENARLSSHIPFIFGTYLNPRIALGGGLGLEFNEVEISGFEFNTSLFTQFIYGRYYLTETKKRPFIFSRIGYGSRAEGTDSNDNDKGGLNFKAGAGIHFSGRQKSKFILSIGYYLQEIEGTELFRDEFGGEIRTDYDVMIRRLTITFSAEFNNARKGYQERKRRR